MTAYPVPENHDHWWLTTRASWKRLHAVAKEHLDPDDRDAFEELVTEIVILPTVCGLSNPMAYGGILTRFAAPRCAFCCRILGIPRGDGTPVNEASILGTTWKAIT